MSVVCTVPDDDGAPIAYIIEEDDAGTPLSRRISLDDLKSALAQPSSDSHVARGERTLDSGHASGDAQKGSAAADSPPESIAAPSPIDSSARADALLLLYADALDDLERVRIATENRVRSLVQVKGMEGTPEQARLEGLCDSLRALEHGAELELKRALRRHPLGPWVKRTIGIGEKQGGRLLAAIGDPAERHTVSQLWAYCGYHVLNPGHIYVVAHDADAGVQPLHPGHPCRGPQHATAGVEPSSDTAQRLVGLHTSSGGVAPSRRRGQKANWNATAKMRAFLCAESCIKKASSPYRAVYDEGRAKYADAVHNHECVRCGPSGKPAPVGSPLNPGHQHARALRLVAKAILRDLWIEAKAVGPS